MLLMLPSFPPPYPSQPIREVTLAQDIEITNLMLDTRYLTSRSVDCNGAKETTPLWQAFSPLVFSSPFKAIILGIIEYSTAIAGTFNH